jgi:DNA-binding transcriptional ArsR family regulator
METDSKKPTMDEYKELDTIGLTEKVEIISTDDIKIKSVGELLSADSSRNILKLLFEQTLTANQIAQKTGISLPLVIYHLKKMQEMGIVKITNVGKNVKAQDMKYYTSSKFAIVILPSNLTEKAKTSRSLANSFKTIYRFASIAVAAVATWFVSQTTLKIQTGPPLIAPIAPGERGPVPPTTVPVPAAPNAAVQAPATTGMQSAVNNAGSAANTAPTIAPPTTAPMVPPSGAEHQAGPAMSPFMAPITPPNAGIAVDILWSVIFTLSVVVVGLIIERVLRAYRH